MVAFGKLHLMVLSAYLAFVVNEHGAIEYVIRNLLSQPEDHAKFQFASQILKSPYIPLEDPSGKAALIALVTSPGRR